MVYTGENIDAATAQTWGLVEKVVDAGALDDAVEEWVAAIVESGPRAIRLQKELVRSWESMPVTDAIQEGIRCMGKAYETDEPRRMVDAALARLKARKK
jgi:enoyl-CoA hydratase/carnithine racemase